jgi:hypothetical protein
MPPQPLPNPTIKNHYLFYIELAGCLTSLGCDGNGTVSFDDLEGWWFGDESTGLVTRSAVMRHEGRTIEAELRRRIVELERELGARVGATSGSGSGAGSGAGPGLGSMTVSMATMARTAAGQNGAALDHDPVIGVVPDLVIVHSESENDALFAGRLGEAILSGCGVTSVLSGGLTKVELEATVVHSKGVVVIASRSLEEDERAVATAKLAFSSGRRLFACLRQTLERGWPPRDLSAELTRVVYHDFRNDLNFALSMSGLNKDLNSARLSSWAASSDTPRVQQPQPQQALLATTARGHAQAQAKALVNDVYLLHAPSDIEVAMRARSSLEARGLAVRMDGQSLRTAGGSWEVEAEKAMTFSLAVVPLLTSSFVESEVAAAELRIASALQRTLVPVLVEPGVPWAAESGRPVEWAGSPDPLLRRLAQLGVVAGLAKSLPSGARFAHLAAPAGGGAAAGEAPSARYGSALVHFGSFVVMIGGLCRDVKTWSVVELREVHRMDTATLQWKNETASVIGQWPARLRGASFTPAGDGTVVVFGGGDYRSCSNLVFTLDLPSLTWSKMLPRTRSGLNPAPRFGHAAVLVGRAVLVLGGRLVTTSHHEYASFDSVWSLDLQAEAWTEVATSGPAPSARADHTATLVGRHIVVLGGAQHGEPPLPMTVLHLLDTYTFAWSTVIVGGAVTPSPRFGHAAVLLGSSLVVTGGMGGQRRVAALADTVTLDLSDGVVSSSLAWSNPIVPPAAIGGRSFAATAQIGGKLLVTHGGDPFSADQRADGFVFG